MENKPKNPPAFPGAQQSVIIPFELLDNPKVQQIETHCNGMTLRDYFAAAALTGLLSNTPLRFQDITNTNDMALLSYNIANAMLKARQAND